MWILIRVSNQRATCQRGAFQKNAFVDYLCGYLIVFRYGDVRVLFLSIFFLGVLASRGDAQVRERH